MTARSYSIAAAIALTACAANPGTRPQDMSAAEHIEHAEREESEAASHNAQAESSTRPTVVEWVTLQDPGQQHRNEAKRHLELADAHRRASAELRSAEERACKGVDAKDVATSPFGRPQDILRSEEIRVVEPDFEGAAEERVVGGRALFGPVPGLTRVWFQHLIDCHQARAASVGFEMPEMSYCPLALKGAKATVKEASKGYWVEVTAEDPLVVREILKRMQLTD